jgi:hypothetical protein
LPDASLTFERSDWKLRTRREIVVRQKIVNGFANQSPAPPAVPT